MVTGAGDHWRSMRANLDTGIDTTGWRQLQAGGDHAPAAAERMAMELAGEFLRHAFGTGRVRLRCIDRLCEMAMHPDPEVARPGVQALYGSIVEGLCDDFSERGVRICNLVLVRILFFMAGLPEGREIAALLSRDGAFDPALLLCRYQRLRTAGALPAAARGRVRRAVVLSRVSAGADVAITSIIVQRLLAAFPRAEIVLAGPGHLPEFFARSSRLRCLRLDYPRQGLLRDRFGALPRLIELLAGESRGLPADQFLLFDPDSRLSQLGLLPLAREGQTCYFSSRTNPLAGHQPSLPELTNFWLDQLLAEENPQAPGLFLPESVAADAGACCARLRQKGARRLLVINLGVGNNPRKRLADPFEEELLATLLQAQENTVILLDTGGDSEEKERIRSLMAAAGRRGFPTAFLDQAEMAGWEAPFAQGVVGFHGSLGALAALIDQADTFCGYDSCGQHLAGALRRPAVIIFAGAPNPRFYARWRSPVPTTATIPVETAPLSARERAAVLDKVVSCLHPTGAGNLPK